MFVVPDIMGGAKSALMGNIIQNQFLAARDWPFGSALSIILAFLALLMILCTTKALQAQKGGAQHAKTWRSTLLVAFTPWPSWPFCTCRYLSLPSIPSTIPASMPSGPAFTLKWYASLLSNDRVLEALTNSLLIASITTVVTTIMGTFAAIALHRYQYRSKTVLNSLLYLPILIPEIVMGLSLLILFPSSVFPLGNRPLIVAHITFCLSFVIITVGARLEGSRQDIEEAASDLLRDAAADLPLCNASHDCARHHRRGPHGLYPFHR